MHVKLKKIRIQMGYSVRGFAELLGFGGNHSTYQCYEDGRRALPVEVLQAAQAAYRRDRNFFTNELPKHIDDATPNGCPNEAAKGAW